MGYNDGRDNVVGIMYKHTIHYYTVVGYIVPSGKRLHSELENPPFE